MITSVDGKTVANASDLTSLMFPYHPGDKVDDRLGRPDGRRTATVTLVAGPH